MFTSYSDFLVAEYHSLAEINWEEAMSADMVCIHEFLPGGICHSKYTRWKNILNPNKNALEEIKSKIERKAVQKNSALLEALGFRVAVVEMTESLYYEFSRLYQETVLSKPRAIQYSLEDRILGKMKAGMQVYCVGLFKGDVLESGLVFSISKPHEVSVGFGAKKRIDHIRGGVGGVLEYHLLSFCKDHFINSIDLGKSFNPAGIVTTNGLFEFKARYGNSAFPEGEWVTSYMLNPDKRLSDLVYVLAIDSQIGYLVASDDESDNIINRYQTKSIKKVLKIPISNLSKQAHSFKKMYEEAANISI
jgi:hypothetical protein